MSCFKSQKSSSGISAALASAFLEWSLIFMLVIIAVFSYLITKFAVYCHLQVPCLLCSRLDHALGNKKRKYYWDLICRNHKLEISSLVFCHLHKKLVDVHSMCETCLFSCPTMNKSSAETYRSLVGKLGEDSKCGFDQNPPLDCRNSNHLNIRCCSCCNEPLNLKGNSEKVLQIKSLGYGAAEHDMALSAVGHNQDAIDKRIEKTSASFRVTRKRNCGLDLSHIGYTELTITSDTESETVLSNDNDNDDASAPNCQTNPQEDLTTGSVEIKPCIFTLPQEVTSEKLIGPFSAPEPSVSKVQANVIKTHDVTNVISTVSVGHGLVELDWEDFKGDPSSCSEIMPLEEIPPSSITKDTTEAPKESRTMSLENVFSPMDAMETPIEVSKGVARTGEVVQSPMTGHVEICEARSDATTTNDTATETNPISSDNSQHLSGLLDLSDAYKLAVGGKGRQPSGMLSEQLIRKDSSRLGEDLKQLLSQISSARGFELSVNDVSTTMSVHSDELRISNVSNATGLKILQKRISLERNESGLESLDGSIVSEIEGESVVDRLKRQIEHDKKLLHALYKELEEERNASAIAVNQAMAMITKLQEEKAALHMEALQNLRIMEEQAEYDMEALQKANDIHSRKEEEIQDLEVKLAYYINKYPDESMLEKLLEPNLARDVTVDLEASFTEDGTKVGKEV